MPPLVVAAQSVSLEFPLEFGAYDAPPGYIKVDAASGGNDADWHLIDALVLCGPELIWIEKTSHTMSIIMPSEENAVWGTNKGRRPSDEDIIACIKETANQDFFYRKLPTGTQTYRRN